MSVRKILRAVARPIKRVLRPMRLRFIGWRIKRSNAQLERLRSFRRDIFDLEREQCFRQVKLAVRRAEIERG